MRQQAYFGHIRASGGYTHPLDLGSIAMYRTCHGVRRPIPPTRKAPE